MFWLRLALIFLAVWLVSGDMQFEELDQQEQLERNMLQERKEVCLIAKTSYGNCNGKRKMWYYNVRRNKCHTFIYSNCGGNRNRFYTHEECMEFCGGYNLQEYQT
ncbi:kunitz-type serine protease inhibitor 2-like [Drosophila pseudoobscura]|uniref:Kunitz-type serine protease inhibitor 2-like n=1 Tax=Drosophila pseudoobscura pseudoobscura TaxID=46245 RepID=A0A6I8V256_DROPS|nr:kunitz-type serine protease inhibitor 2 [Drosophila pseudoobscura]